MIIRIYYQNCWLDIETKNFKTVKEIEDHITGFSKTFTQRPEPNVKAQGMYIDWLEEDMKVGQKVRFNLMDVIEIREKKIKELKKKLKKVKAECDPIDSLFKKHDNLIEEVLPLVERIEELEKQVKDLKQVIQEAVVDVNKAIEELEKDHD